MNYFEQHHDEYLENLKAFLRIPSISTLTEHKPDIRRAAEFVRDSLGKAGLQNAELIEGEGNPLVYARWAGTMQFRSSADENERRKRAWEYLASALRA